jgi:phage gp29-like protein
MGLLDAYGKEIRKDRPILDEIGGVGGIRDRYSTYPSQGLTPEKLTRIFRDADQGEMLRQAELFEEMEEKDAHLGAVLQTRKLAVAGLEWEVVAARPSRGWPTGTTRLSPSSMRWARASRSPK